MVAPPEGRRAPHQGPPRAREGPEGSGAHGGNGDDAGEERGREDPTGPDDAGPAGDDLAREVAALLGAMSVELRSLCGELGVLARLRWYRVSLALREGLVLALLGVVALSTVLTAAVLGTYALAAGTSDLLAAWTQRPWLARLLTGSLLLALVVGGLLLARRRLGAALVRRAQGLREEREHREAADRLRQGDARSPRPPGRSPHPGTTP